MKLLQFHYNNTEKKNPNLKLQYSLHVITLFELLLAISVSAGLFTPLNNSIISSINIDSCLSNVYTHISGMIHSNTSKNNYGKDQFFLLLIHHRKMSY